MLRKLGLTALWMAADLALAQTSRSAPAPNPVTPVAPLNAALPPPEKIAPPERDPGHTLSRQKGTITPPNVDPGMRVTPPRNGSTATPVSPPPGSPRGNGSVVPK
jgi:hypothetical protein